jgi:hypothetical protein
MEAIRQEGAVGDAELGRRLLAIATDDQRPSEIRVAALRLAWEKADAEIADAIVKLALRWADEACYSKVTKEQRMARVEPLASKSDMLCWLILDGWEYVVRAGAEPKPMLDFLVQAATDAWLSHPAWNEATRALADCPAALKDKQAAVVEVIRRQRFGQPPGYLVELLDESSFPTLREWVRAGRTPETFNFNAAYALTWHGDKEILDYLKALQPSFQDVGSTPRGYLAQGIAMIEMQQPPEQLLDFIASSPEPPTYCRRDWAIQRAAMLGLPKGEIRKAILAHAKYHTFKNELGERQSLRGLKEMGLKMGVLREGDLPDVPTERR